MRKPIERRHFSAIISFVYRNRLCIASQVQRRFSKFLRSDRTARRHLEELQALGLLDVMPGRGLGRVFPKVYYVTGKGLRRLRESFAANGKSWTPSRRDRSGRRTDEGLSADHVIHELLVTEFMLGIWQTVEARADLELLKVERRSLAKHPSFQVTVANRQTRLVPDAMFLFRQAGAGMCCCFLELDNGTMNPKQIRRKFARYAAWAQSSAGQKYLIELYKRHGAKEPMPTFRLLLVARSRTGLDDDARLAELVAAAKRAPGAVQGRLWMTTVAALRQQPADCIPFEGKPWLRIRAKTIQPAV
jgi:hypothetical protein